MVTAKEKFITEITEKFSNVSDFTIKKFLNSHNQELKVLYLKDFIDTKVLEKSVRHMLSSNERLDYGKLHRFLPFVDTEIISINDSKEKVLQKFEKGWAILSLEREHSSLLLVSLTKTESRSLSQPENEAIIIGPQVSFNEDLKTNIGQLRKILPTRRLCIKDMMIGSEISKSVSFVYLDGLANPRDVKEMERRLNDINSKYDTVFNAAQLAQMLEDNPLSLFPVMRLTERPDDAAYSIVKGKIVVLAENSTYAVISPSRMSDFLHSPEDVNLRWPIAIFIRTIRMFAIFLSIILTPLYVGALTYHYEVIPQALLTSIGSSRSQVPFPPLLEALLLEFIIELLREAGARLPTKVGQTIGIVGGIVIGTAAVEAGFTSNILIMLVALGALASFITPSYLMGTIVRFVRFPMILLAGALGFFGMASGLFFLALHAIRQYSLGSPYFLPLFPFSKSGFGSLFFHLPLNQIHKGNIFKKAVFTLKRYDHEIGKVGDIDE